MSLLLVYCKPTGQTTTANLESTYWKLAEVNGTPVTTPENGREVHMVLDGKEGEKRVSGFAGCNGLGGDYTLDGDKIKFTIITTKMFCDDRMDVENFLTDALNKADNYKIKDNTLELYQGSTFLIRFEAAEKK